MKELIIDILWSVLFGRSNQMVMLIFSELKTSEWLKSDIKTIMCLLDRIQLDALGIKGGLGNSYFMIL